MAKRPSLKTAKRRAWEALSMATRLNGSVDGFNHCVTCLEEGDVTGAPKPRVPIKELSAGHYIPKARGLAAYFNEDNVWPQCSGCNISLGGNPYFYTRFMIRTFGEERVQALHAECTRVVKYTVEDYLEMEQRWKQAIARLT